MRDFTILSLSVGSKILVIWIKFVYDKIAQTGPLTTAMHNKFSPEAIKLKAT